MDWESVVDEVPEVISWNGVVLSTARFPQSSMGQGACETLPGGLEPPTRAGAWRQDVLPVAGRHVGTGNLVRDETSEDVVMTLLMNEMGFYRNSFKRETRKTGRRFISEIYSPPRITEELKRGKYSGIFEPGLALDLTTNDPTDGLPWDFDIRERREEAKRLVQTRRSLLLIGIPMCAAFRQLQTLNSP